MNTFEVAMPDKLYKSGTIFCPGTCDDYKTVGFVMMFCCMGETKDNRGHEQFGFIVMGKNYAEILTRNNAGEELIKKDRECGFSFEEINDFLKETKFSDMIMKPYDSKIILTPMI